MEANPVIDDQCFKETNKQANKTKEKNKLKSPWEKKDISLSLV